MGIINSHNNLASNEEPDTLCFNIDIFQNDTSKLFYKIISNMQNLFNVNIKIGLLETKSTRNIHSHFEIHNCLFEIKLIKVDKLYSLGYIKTTVKLFTQKNNTINKEKFYKLCSYIDN